MGKRMSDKKFHEKAVEAYNSEGRGEFIKAVLWHNLWEHPYSKRCPSLALMEEDVNEWYAAFQRPEDETWETLEGTEGCYHDCVYLEFVFVDPLTHCIEDDPKRNTLFEVWVEAGGWRDMSIDQDHHMPAPAEGWNDMNKWLHSHDTRLDCGASNLELALCELGVRLNYYYNPDGTEKP